MRVELAGADPGLRPPRASRPARAATTRPASRIERDLVRGLDLDHPVPPSPHATSASRPRRYGDDTALRRTGAARRSPARSRRRPGRSRRCRPARPARRRRRPAGRSARRRPRAGAGRSRACRRRAGTARRRRRRRRPRCLGGSKSTCQMCPQLRQVRRPDSRRTTSSSSTTSSSTTSSSWLPTSARIVVQRLGLRHGAREAVEQEPVVGVVLPQPVAHHRRW